MNNMLRLIGKMHAHFGITAYIVPFSLPEKDFRVRCLEEEIKEYHEAETKADELDALVDLVVFALGTAERQGMLGVFEEAFERVMKANMVKQVGKNEKRDNFAIDLIKPEGWTAPDLTDLVKHLEK